MRLMGLMCFSSLLLRLPNQIMCSVHGVKLIQNVTQIFSLLHNETFKDIYQIGRAFYLSVTQNH